jgi:hypothetical protein
MFARTAFHHGPDVSCHITPFRLNGLDRLAADIGPGRASEKGHVGFCARRWRLGQRRKSAAI